jgi:putative tricarboxylic transport membrane protein
MVRRGRLPVAPESEVLGTFRATRRGRLSRLPDHSRGRDGAGHSFRPFEGLGADSLATPSDPLPSPSPVRRPDVGEVLLALGSAAFGAAVIWQTTQIRLTPAYAMVGPRAIPNIVGVGLVAVGLWLLVEAVTGRGAGPAAGSEDVDLSLPTDWRAVGLVALALVAYLVLIEPAGFVVASTLLFAGAAFAMGSRRPARDAALGLLLALALYLGFTRGLGLDLPAGVLVGVL